MGKLLFILYRVVIYILVPVLFVRYLLKGIFDQSYQSRLAERFGKLPSSIQAKSIWVHAVSVGEVNAAVPLVNQILDNFDCPVVMTCVTPTGSEQIKKSFGARVQHVYAPLDVGWIVKIFFKKLNPRSLIILETEIWPNLIHHASRSKVPVNFASLRISDRTFHSANRWKPLCEYVLQNVTAFGAQTQVDADRIIQLGANRSRVQRTGNLKFDFEPPQHLSSMGSSLRDSWGGKRRETVILGSSHEQEEEQFLAIFQNLKEEFSQLVAVIVPRHPDRFDAVYQIIVDSGFSVVRRTQWDVSSLESADVILVDAMGELMQFYAASDVAIVGGSFVPIGGHNILEPILVGIPVIFGPDMSNFKEISRLVSDAKAGQQVQNWRDCKETIMKLLKNPDEFDSSIRQGQELLARNRGALKRTLAHLKL